MGLAFSCTTSTAAESSAMTGTARVRLRPDSRRRPSGVVVLTDTATLFGAHLLAEAGLRSGLGLPPAGSRVPRPDVPERADTQTCQ
jgi:hypothetical protein